jgi:hypothetical protein
MSAYPADAEKGVAQERTGREPEQEQQLKGGSETDPVLSTIAETDANKTADVDEIPDGGLVAWLQVLGSFALFFNSW